MSGLISIIVPLYRTAESVEELVDRLRSAVPQARLALVDDGCPEGSGDVVATSAGGDRNVVVLRHGRNRGQQEAIRTGLLATVGSVRVVLDADLQDPPEAVPLLLNALHRERVDAVFAGRRGAYESHLRRAGGIVHRRVLHAGLGLPRDAGGFVAMTDRCAAAVLSLDGPPQLVAMIGRTGLPTTSIPVTRAARPHGQSSTGTLSRLRHAAAGLAHVGRNMVRSGTRREGGR